MVTAVVPPYANPWSVTLYALPVASVTCNVACRTPDAFATNRSHTWHASPAVIRSPLHSSARTAKSAAFTPVTETPLIVVLPVATTVTGTTVFGAPTSVVGQRTIPGAATVAPTSTGSFSFTSPHTAG